MAKPDFYELLGVSRDADEKTLKSAFRKKAMQYHPDRNPGDAEAEQSFKAVNEAYEVLRDEQKRAAYDRFGHQAFEQGGMGGGGFGGAGMGAAGMGDIFEEIFGEFMGGASAALRQAARRVARTCATISKSRWKRPSRARPSIWFCRHRWPAIPAQVRAPSPAPARRPARPAAAWARCA
jgi:DnaJ-class molecular chaperone